MQTHTMHFKIIISIVCAQETNPNSNIENMATFCLFIFKEIQFALKRIIKQNQKNKIKIEIHLHHEARTVSYNSNFMHLDLQTF